MPKRLLLNDPQNGTFPSTDWKVKTDHLTITRLHHSLLELIFCCCCFFFLQRASKPTLSGVLLWCKKWWSQGVEFSLWTVSKVICCKRKTAVSFWFGWCKWTLAIKQVKYLRRKPENEAWIPMASRKIFFSTQQVTLIFWRNTSPSLYIACRWPQLPLFCKLSFD